MPGKNEQYHGIGSASRRLIFNIHSVLKTATPCISLYRIRFFFRKSDESALVIQFASHRHKLRISHLPAEIHMDSLDVGITTRRATVSITEIQFDSGRTSPVRTLQVRDQFLTA